MRFPGLILAALLMTATISPGAAENGIVPDGRPVAGSDPWKLGVYDPNGDFTNDAIPAIEHLFLPWEDVELSTLAIADDYASARGRSLLVTIEPWTWDQRRRLQPADLRSGVFSGVYDGNIAAVCTEIGRLGGTVQVRWAQEMEDANGRFIWANWSPSDYIAAYRKFVTGCRVHAPRARFMWSPKGLPNLAEYYPGDDVVDDIGLSVFGLQAYDQDNFGRDRTFAEYLKPGYDLVLPFNKPIYVAELAYVGKEPYVRAWARDVLARDPQFDRLVGVVYFDDQEVWPWFDPYGLPNWRVTDNILP
jgi:beta-mannanase